MMLYVNTHSATVENGLHLAFLGVEGNPDLEHFLSLCYK